MSIDEQDQSADGRLALLRAWLDRQPGLAGATLASASADASFRRYFRATRDGESFIVMDAPPAREDCRPFIRVAGYLEAMTLNAPRVLEADLEQGFLLLTDLGSMPYLEKLTRDPSATDELYDDAIDALALLQSKGVAYQSALPDFDADQLYSELLLFHDWLCGLHLGIELSAVEQLAWRNCCSMLMRNALDQPQVFVHRDYHSRNLMFVPEGNPGIIDFQDAVEGPLTYDLVSLLRDCYTSLPPAEVERRVLDFRMRLEPNLRGQVGPEQFVRNFDLMGVQRHLKAAGIFARLNHRDGKSAYMADVPRTLGYIIELEPAYPELSFLTSFIAERVLPALEG
jgi:aminoglycoside/choline kinase family phosphotransferase